MYTADGGATPRRVPKKKGRKGTLINGEEEIDRPVGCKGSHTQEYDHIQQILLIQCYKSCHPIHMTCH